MAVRVSGKIVTLIGDRPGLIIQLDNDPAMGPKDNVWLLKEDHRNYNGLFSLTLAAAANRWPITIRIEGDSQIDPTIDAAIKTISVVWKD